MLEDYQKVKDFNSKAIASALDNQQVRLLRVTYKTWRRWMQVKTQ